MALNSLAIATGIAALGPITASGTINILDITAEPQQVQPRDCPVMFPMPNGWMGGGNNEPSDGPETFGTPTTRSWVFNRSYKYVYLHAPAGAGRGLLDNNPGMSQNADAIISALVQLDLTNIDVKNVGIGQFGVLQDPAGSKFYGYLVTVMLRERINA